MGKESGKLLMSRKEFLRSSGLVGVAAGAALPQIDLVSRAHAATNDQTPWPFLWGWDESLTSKTTGFSRWGFVVDLRRCIGCKACIVACKTEFDVRLGVFRASVKELVAGDYPASRKLHPWLCNHCKKPLCITQCPVDEMEAEFTFPDGKSVTYMKRATYQRPDGVVLVDQDRCIGCGKCVRLCPYGVRYLDPGKPAGGNPDGHPADKCILCEHRLAEGVVPSCVNTCQARARFVGDLNDPDSEISKLLKEHNAQQVHPEYTTDPQCYYIGYVQAVYDKGEDANKKQQNSAIYQL